MNNTDTRTAMTIEDTLWVTGRIDNLTNEELAEWFFGRANGVSTVESATYHLAHPTHAPAASDPVSGVWPLGGALFEAVATTADDFNSDRNYYSWFDLTDECVVWRVSMNGTWYMFGRSDTDLLWKGLRFEETCGFDAARKGLRAAVAVDDYDNALHDLVYDIVVDSRTIESVIAAWGD